MRTYYWLFLASLVAGAACSSSVEPARTQSSSSELDISSAYGIAASSATVRDPDTRIRYVLHVTNGSDSNEELSYGACWGSLRFYTSEARAGTPVFDQAGRGTGCTTQLIETTVPPGGSADLVGYLGMNTLISAGVPQGHYYVSLVVAPNGTTTEIAAGEVDVGP